MSNPSQQSCEAEQMGRIYLYGIIDSGDGATFDSPGVDGVSTVYTVAHDGIACVVSDYSGEEFGALSKEKLVRSLLAHQQAIERMMQYHTVVPVKFGTFLAGPREVSALLSQGHSCWVDALASTCNRVEIEVAATWDTSRVLQEIGNEEEVVRARETIAREGQPTLEERLQLGQLAKEYMDKRRASYRELAMGSLRPLSDDVATNALISDEMVMNLAFLVNRDQQEEFDKGVRQLDRLFQNEIDFRVIGPLPPYSFRTVEVTSITPEQIDEARRTLHLGDVVSEAEVRRAYRRLAAEGQRSMKPGDKLNSTQLTKLRQASELLLAYLRTNPGTPPQPKDSVFLITIRRSRAEELLYTPWQGYGSRT